jgi:hypothetical protein
MEAADLRHMETAADLDVIAARKILLLIVEQPPGNVDVHPADTVRIVARKICHGGNVTRQAVTSRVRKVAPYHAGFVRNAVRKSRRLGIQQQARRFAGARRDNRRPASNLLFRPRGFINV